MKHDMQYSGTSWCSFKHLINLINLRTKPTYVLLNAQMLWKWWIKWFHTIFVANKTNIQNENIQLYVSTIYKIFYRKRRKVRAMAGFGCCVVSSVPRNHKVSHYTPTQQRPRLFGRLILVFKWLSGTRVMGVRGVADMRQWEWGRNRKDKNFNYNVDLCFENPDIPQKHTYPKASNTLDLLEDYRTVWITMSCQHNQVDYMFLCLSLKYKKMSSAWIINRIKITV